MKKCPKHDIKLIPYPKGSPEKGVYCPKCEKERIWDSDSEPQLPKIDKYYDGEGSSLN